MFMKSMIIFGSLASLMLVASPSANAQSQNRRAYCEDYARRVGYRQIDPGAVIGGAVGGAVLGGIVGAVTGEGRPSNVGTGAAVGGVAGGAIGAATSQGRMDRGLYDRAFVRCMNEYRPRRYERPVRVYDEARPAYTEERPYGTPPVYTEERRAYPRPAYRNRVRDRRAVEYCLSRYRSYNPDTGYYLSSSGQYRRCP